MKGYVVDYVTEEDWSIYIRLIDDEHPSWFIDLGRFKNVTDAYMFYSSLPDPEEQYRQEMAIFN